jgi:hypothetical protein
MGKVWLSSNRSPFYGVRALRYYAVTDRLATNRPERPKAPSSGVKECIDCRQQLT